MGSRNKSKISNFTKRIGREVLIGAYSLFDTSAEQKSDVPTEQAHEQMYSSIRKCGDKVVRAGWR